MKVVMYHYVQPLNKVYLKGLKGLDFEDFKIQLDFFQKNYIIIDHEIFYNHLLNHIPIPDNFLLLTFDDGYSDIYKYVFPELHKRNLKGLFYIPDLYTENKLLNVNSIHILLTKPEYINLYLNEIKDYIKLNIKLESYDTYISKINYQSRYDTKEIETLKYLLQYLLPSENRIELINFLLSKYINLDNRTLFNEFYCTKDQLNIMIDEGMHIGGHGVKHDWLSELDYKNQKNEIDGSYNFLKSLNKQEFFTFCYPFGMYNSDTLNILKMINCKFAFTTKVANYNSLVNSNLEIPRYDTNDFYPKS